MIAEEKESQPGRYSGRLLKPSEAAEALNVNVATIRRWLHDGLLKGIEMPKRAQGKKSMFRVRGEAVDKILEG